MLTADHATDVASHLRIRLPDPAPPGSLLDRLLRRIWTQRVTAETALGDERRMIGGWLRGNGPSLPSVDVEQGTLSLIDEGRNTAMLQSMKTHILAVQARGTVALPADLRRRLHLDQADSQVKLIEHEDGRLELVPVVAVPADQAWFWTERWQALEREADADIAAGRMTVVEGIDGLIAHLDS